MPSKNSIVVSARLRRDEYEALQKVMEMHNLSVAGVLRFAMAKLKKDKPTPMGEGRITSKCEWCGSKIYQYKLFIQAVETRFGEEERHNFCSYKCMLQYVIENRIAERF